MTDIWPCPECGSLIEATPRKRRKCPTCGTPLYSLQSHGVFASRYLSAGQRRVIQLAKRIDGFYPGLLDPTNVSSLDVIRASKSAADPWPSLRSAVECGDDPLSALRAFCSNFQRTIPDHILPSWLWQMAYMPWKDPLTTRREMHRVQLRREQRSGVLKSASIVTQGRSACPACAQWEGITFAIEEALDLMPLPHPDCSYVPTALGVDLAHRYRCSYAFSDEAPEVFGRRFNPEQRDLLLARVAASEIGRS